jgi:hypothetical protein
VRGVSTELAIVEATKRKKQFDKETKRFLRSNGYDNRIVTENSLEKRPNFDADWLLPAKSNPAFFSAEEEW